jgi:hypothetical protein
MKPNITLKMCCMLIAIGSLSLVRTSQATLIAYDSFNYSPDVTLSTQNGGTGWMGPWLGANLGGGGGNPAEVNFGLGNGLNWSNATGGYILGNGSAIFDHDGSAHSNGRQWFTPDDGSNPSTDITLTYGTNIWFSFIATYDTAAGSGGGVNPFENIFDSINGAGVVCTGPAGGGDFVVQIRGGAFGQGAHSGTAANLTSSTPGTNLVVGRFQLTPGLQSSILGTDRIDVWLNQTTEPTSGSDLYFTGFSAPRGAVYSSGYAGIRTGGGCAMTIDEFKIGTTFADVVPSTAKSPNPRPASPALSLENAGPPGLQFNTSEATPTNSSEIVSYYTTNSIGSPIPIESSWVGKTPASYSFTIAKPPALGPSNFMAFVWLIPNPNGHIQALDNPNAVQLALISDGNGSAKAVLGYLVNGTSSVQQNLATLFTSPVTSGIGGVMCSIPSAPFAGTWTISLSSDTAFTITAPNGAHASGTMQSGDQGNFSSGVKFFLGVSPNGAPNTGNPCLGYYMTVSGLAVTNNTDGVVVQADWTDGQPLTAPSLPNFLPLADFPSCIYVTPSNSVYRATWGNASGPGVGANSLVTTNTLGGSAVWPISLPSTSVLSDGTNVTFITTTNTADAAGFFRVSIPFTP